MVVMVVVAVYCSNDTDEIHLEVLFEDTDDEFVLHSTVRNTLNSVVVEVWQHLHSDAFLDSSYRSNDDEFEGDVTDGVVVFCECHPVQCNVFPFVQIHHYVVAEAEVSMLSALLRHHEVEGSRPA